MTILERWSRRRFLAVSATAAAQSAVYSPLLAQAAAAMSPLKQISDITPLVIPRGITPLLHNGTARPLRYLPVDGDFVVRNGSEFFNRPLYGQNNDFRVDAGDRPEFSLYSSGHGGNLKLGIATSAGTKWAADADEVIARYRPGRMIYEIRDSLLAQGSVEIEVLTATAGVLVKVEPNGIPQAATLVWAFAGASGRRGSRSGDIGCESEPVSLFFQVRPEECANNHYVLESTDASGTGPRPSAQLHSPGGDLLFSFPTDSRLSIEDFRMWQQPPTAEAKHSGGPAPQRPILTGSVELANSPRYMALWSLRPEDRLSSVDPAVESDLRTVDPAIEFERRSAQIAALAATIQMDTPDPYINAAAGAIGPPSDALWDTKQGCVMHGDVAWRAALAGWRGPYYLDALGNHERAKQQFRHWIVRQNVTPIETSDPATGPADPGTRLARKEAMLHSNGDLSHNHYDMNMVFFDVLQRHLRWTGDLAFAREIWPAFKRQLAWEHRMFRRTYSAANGRSLPLYEAYAAIWASDNLQYSGGGAAHSSAYNVFAFRSAAMLAHLLDEDPAPYEKEAKLIHEGMQELLWLPEQGVFAESRDFYTPQTAYNNPALWTVYHTIDSEVPTPRQAWQMIAERLAVLGRVPVHGDGVPPGPWFMLGCSNWMPYMWSLTLLVLAENMHMALAMWEAGMADDAYALLKGNLLDTMYQGLCPGDFHMSSELDPHRHESQRDFGDPIGITSRALIEGLFGIQPNLIANEIRFRPGFPSDWNRASLKHSDFDLTWRRDTMSELYEFTSRFPRLVPFSMVLPARTTSLPLVTCNGACVECAFDPAAVGAPVLHVKLPPAASYKISIQWHGKPSTPSPVIRSYRLGEKLQFPHGVSPTQIDDPQRALSAAHTVSVGFHTVFANIKEVDSEWSMPICFEVEGEPPLAPVPKLARGAHPEPLDLSAVLVHQITEIFSQPYAEPRSPFCALSIPDTLLGGWSSLGNPVTIDDSGLRGAGGLLQTAIGVPFRTPAGQSPNCVLLSYFKPYSASASIPLNGKAIGLYLLVTGTTLPQCSRVENALVSVSYADGSSAKLSLRNPETWWPIEQDYLIDDYMFAYEAPLPPRVDLRSGQTRVLELGSFKGKGRDVPGGAATVLHLPLDPAKRLIDLKMEVSLYPVVAALLAATLVRPKPAR